MTHCPTCGCADQPYDVRPCDHYCYGMPDAPAPTEPAALCPDAHHLETP